MAEKGQATVGFSPAELPPPYSASGNAYNASDFGYDQPQNYAHPAGPGYLPSMQAGPVYPPSMQAGPVYPPSMQAGPGYLPSMQAGPVYPPSMQAGPGYPPSMQAGPVYPPSMQAAPGYPPSMQAGPGYPPSVQAAPGYVHTIQPVPAPPANLVVVAPRATDALAISIFSIFCCFPLGIFATVTASGARDALQRGDREGACAANSKARKLAIAAIVLGFFFYVMAVILVCLLPLLLIQPAFDSSIGYND